MAPLLLLPVLLCSCGGALSLRPAAAPSGHCGTGNDNGGFALSLVTDTGGEETPEQAAERFIRTGGVWSAPVAGWRTESRDANGTTVVSAQSFLHVIQGSDQTWQVGSGYRCSAP